MPRRDIEKKMAHEVAQISIETVDIDRKYSF
jgi:hypothetical protein